MRFAFGGTANSSRPLLDSSSIPFASPGLPSEPSDQDAWNVNPVEADTQNRSGVQSAGQSGEQNGQQNVQEGEEAKPFFSSKLHGWSVGAAGGTWPTYAEDNQLEVLEAPAAPTTAPEGPEAGEGAISEHPKHAESTEHPEHPRCGSSEDEAQSQSNPCSSDLDAVSEARWVEAQSSLVCHSFLRKEEVDPCKPPQVEQDLASFDTHAVIGNLITRRNRLNRGVSWQQEKAAVTVSLWCIQTWSHLANWPWTWTANRKRLLTSCRKKTRQAAMQDMRKRSQTPA